MRSSCCAAAGGTRSSSVMSGSTKAWQGCGRVGSRRANAVMSMLPPTGRYELLPWRRQRPDLHAAELDLCALRLNRDSTAICCAVEPFVDEIAVDGDLQGPASG